MDSVIRNVSDLSADERHVYEDVLGQPLRNDQQVVVKVVGTDAGLRAVKTNGTENLLANYAIWADLSDVEIADLESAILERSDSRPS